MSLIFISHASRPRTQDNFGRGARRAMRFDTRSAATARGVELFLAHPASPPPFGFSKERAIISWPSGRAPLPRPLRGCSRLDRSLTCTSVLDSTGSSPVSSFLFDRFFTCVRSRTLGVLPRCPLQPCGSESRFLRFVSLRSICCAFILPSSRRVLVLFVQRTTNNNKPRRKVESV